MKTTATAERSAEHELLDAGDLCAVHDEFGALETAVAEIGGARF